MQTLPIRFPIFVKVLKCSSKRLVRVGVAGQNDKSPLNPFPTKFANWSAKWEWSDHRWSKRGPFYIFAALWIQESQKMPSAPWRLHYAPFEVQNLPQSFDNRCGFKDLTLFYKRLRTVSLYIDRCQQKVLINLFQTLPGGLNRTHLTEEEAKEKYYQYWERQQVAILC